MTSARRIISLVPLILAVLVLSGCTAKAPVESQEESLINEKIEPQNKTASAGDSFDVEKSYIVSGHPEWSPIMWKEGEKIVGVGSQLIEEISQDLGFKVDSKYEGTWDQVQQKAKDGEVDMIVAAYKTDEREEYMNYSDAYTTDPIALFVKKGKIFPFSQWQDLVGKKGVATVGDSYGQEFDDFMKNKLIIERVTTVDEAFMAVQDGKADYFVYALYSGEKVLNNKSTLGQFETLSKYVAEENFYITIAKKSPLNIFLPQINEIINKHKNDGMIDDLIERNRKASFLQN